MTTYYLNLHECGEIVVDELGHSYGDLEEARCSAVAAARDVMSHEIRAGALCLSCCIVVEDEHRTEVLRIPFREAVKISGL